jgi:hypothetical protein
MQQSLSQVEKCILCERLGEDIRNLLSNGDWEHFDKAEVDVLSEMMVLDVDMLGLRSHLW